MKLPIRKHHSNIKAIFILSLPLLLAILIQPVVGLIDIKMMGFKDNAIWLAALSVAVAIYTQLIWFFSFLFIGTLSFSALSFGKNDNKESLHIFYRNIIIAISLAVLIILFHPLIFSFAFHFINPKEDLIIYAQQYLNIRIYFFFIPLINYVASAWLLAQAKSIYILIYDIIFAAFTIFFNLLFVRVLDMNIEGIALGTVCAEIISLIVLIYIYYYKTDVFQKLSLASLKAALHKRKVFQTLRTNSHLFIRILALIGILMLFNRYSNLFEDNEIIAANAVIFQLLMIMTTTFGTFGEASASLVGKAYAKRDKSTLISLTKASFILSLGLGFIVMGAFYIFLTSIIGFLTQIITIQNIVYNYKIWLLILPLPMIIAFTYDGLLMGVNKIKPLRNASIFAFISFFIAFTILPESLHIHRLWIAFLCTFVARSLYLGIFFHKIVKKGVSYGS